MIAISAVVRPSDGIGTVRTLERSFRRRYENVPIKAHQFIVRFADGPVLVTDEFGVLRVEAVVADEYAEGVFKRSLQAELDERLDGRRLEVDWSRSETVPTALR
ncbi:hypothetical protein ACPEEZ_05260 [Frigoribacterium sp. 2-23]|uniref:hypothetical protein n=1 Tax=Frigoribacterium sp. 2-23 TaxID=3415006 RepID=UPI003C6F4571